MESLVKPMAKQALQELVDNKNLRGIGNLEKVVKEFLSETSYSEVINFAFEFADREASILGFSVNSKEYTKLQRFRRSHILSIVKHLMVDADEYGIKVQLTVIPDREYIEQILRSKYNRR